MPAIRQLPKAASSIVRNPIATVNHRLEIWPELHDADGGDEGDREDGRRAGPRAADEIEGYD